MSRKRHNGILLTEMIVTLAVLGIILACMALAMKTFKDFNQYQLVRQKCIAAAQAQLDSIAVTGKPIGEENIKRLWPKMKTEIRRTDGSGQWEGLKLIRVKATAKDMRKDISVELARYLSPQGEIRQ
ncbi:MAG: type II secretion system protein [Phycisphaerae bacterium]|jgi:type II secretory pathway pseudopilin PulG